MRGLLTAVVRDMMMENDILPVTKKRHMRQTWNLVTQVV